MTKFWRQVFACILIIPLKKNSVQKLRKAIMVLPTSTHLLLRVYLKQFIFKCKKLQELKQNLKK